MAQKNTLVLESVDTAGAAVPSVSVPERGRGGGGREGGGGERDVRWILQKHSWGSRVVGSYPCNTSVICHMVLMAVTLVYQ